MIKISRWVLSLRLPHLHDWQWQGFTARPEGGTYFQQVCTRCPKRRSDKRYAPTPILLPSAKFTVSVRREQLPELHQRAKAVDKNQIDLLNEIIRRALTTDAEFGSAVPQQNVRRLRD